MAQAFNLTAQIQVQANQSDINQTVNRIKKQLQPLGNVNLKVNTNAQALAKANKQTQGLSKGFGQAQKNASSLNKTLAESARRFSVITVATGTLLSLVNAFKRSVRAAIEFETELVKISQVTGKSTGQLKGLTDEVSRLSTSLGVSSSDLLNTSRILLQTGLSADKARKALEVLAKTTLAATFDDIQSTTEGAIAILNQFGRQAAATGNDIKFLEKSLDAINAVSKNFAVESGDLVSAIRRVGGVFSNAGGSVEELVALFTSVRATTRESAETIATGLRTIFTRIQRTETVDQLKELGIQLQDAQGNFVGAFEAIKRLSSGLSGLDPRSFRFSEIVEELGGFRQIGKVIPLINQFTVAQNALNVAQNASGSVSKDAQTAQQALATEIAKTKEQFNELIRSFTSSETFRSTTVFVLKLAQAFISVAESLEPLLPLLGSLFALKVGQGLSSGLSLFRGFKGGSSGIQASKFNSGGMVPGSGNRDTVPAMLTPGEFVIRKKSVEKLGANNLAQMNAKGYASGGPITRTVSNLDKKFPSIPKNRASFKNIQPSDTVSGNIKITSFDEIPPRTSTPVLQQLSSKNTKVSADAFEKIVAKKLKGTLLSPDQSPIDIATARGLTEVKFRPVGAVSNGEILGKLFRDSLGKEAGSTKRRAASLRNYKTTKGGENSNFGTIGLAVPANKDALIKEARSIVRQRNAKKKALGGLIQRFAEGGSVLKTTQVGAAILEPNDPVKASDNIGGVGVKDVQSSQTLKGNRFSRRVGEFIKSKTGVTSRKYTLKRQGLDEKTSGKFSEGILDGVVDGVTTASNRLGADLGLGNVPVAQDSIAGLRRFFGQEGSVVGQLFEAAVNNVSNLGKFSESAIGAPFDFAGGISGPLSDNYSKLPKGFVDAKKSYGVATKANFKGKIANQIGREFLSSSFNGPKKAATGGPAGSDTVPALLTPGEFVFNKKAADSIGRSNLDRMNKQGVARFAKGGSVGGVQRFESGGGVRPGQFGVSSGKDLALVNAAAKKNAAAFTKLTQEISQLKPEQQRAALVSFARNVDKVSSDTTLLDKSMVSAVASITEVSNKSATLAKREAALEQSLAQEDARRGKGEKRTTGSVGTKIAGDSVAKAEKAIDGFGLSAKESRRTLLEFKREAAKGTKEEVALQKALNNAGKRQTEQADAARKATAAQLEAEKETKKNNTLRKKLGTALSKGASNIAQSFKGGPNAGGPGSRGAREAASLRGAANATQSLQTVAFFGTALSSAATSLFGLRDSASEAINQVTAMGTTFLFLASTVLDIASSIGENAVAKAAAAAAAKADLEKVVAAEAAAGADLKKAGGGIGGTKGPSGGGGIGPIAGSLLAVAAAAAIVATVFTGIAAFWDAEAKRIGKATNDLIASLKEGGKGSAAELKNSVEAEIEARNKANAARTGRTAGVVAGAGGALAGAALGAALGSSIPVIGTVVGALVGLTVGFFAMGAAQKEAEEAAKREAAAVNKAVDSLTGLIAAQNEVRDRLKEISSLPVDDRERTNLRLEAGVGAASDVELSSVKNATDDLTSFMSATGKSFQELSNISEEELGKLQNVSESERAIIKLRSQELGIGLKGLQQSVKESGQTLQDAANLELTGDQDFDAILADPTNAFTKALRQSQQAARNLANAQAQQTRAAAASLAVTASNSDNEEQRNKLLADSRALYAEANNTLSRNRKFLNEQEQAYRNVNVKARENAVIVENERQARVKLLAALKEQDRQINAINQLTKAFDSAGAAIDAFAAGAAGQLVTFDIKAPELNVPTDQLEKNLNEFNNSISSLPPDIRQQGKQAADALADSRRFIEEATEKIVGGDEVAKGTSPDQFIKDNFPDFTKAVDLGFGTAFEVDEDKIIEQFGSNEAAQKFKDTIGEVIANGTIDPEEAARLFAPLEEVNAKYAEKISALTAAANAQLQTQQRLAGLENQIRESQISVLQAQTEAAVEAAGTLAEISGRNPTAARARARTTGVQNQLDQTAASRGFNINVSDPKLLGAQAKRLKQLQALNIAEAARIKATGAGAKAAIDNLKQQQKIKNGLADLGTALKTAAANVTDRISVLKDQLAQEGAIREQQFAVLRDFVVGGKEARESLQAGARGIFSALQTGTTQNLSEEQRGQTFDLLDRLSDVQIGNTGLTGGEVANELVFRDAVRLGFPPEIAKELATSTSTEEQIKQEIVTQTGILQEIKGNLAAVQADNQQALTDAITDLTATIANLGAGGAGGAGGAVGAATGGLIGSGGALYRANGGSVFQPRGTDTVPAMLTPGEFVIKRSSVNKIGQANLAALNDGNATVYRNLGGPVNRATAQTVEDTKGNIAFPTSAQFKNVLIEGAGNARTVISALEDSGRDKSAASVRSLVRTRQFSPKRFVDGITNSTGVLGQVDETNALLTETFSSFNQNAATFRKGVDAAAAKTKISNLFTAQKGFFSNESGSVLTALLKGGGFDILAGYDKALALLAGDNIDGKKFGNTITAKGATRLDKAIAQLTSVGLYLNQGGGVPSADTVPAMLTPGEFVMSPEAVQKYGVGYMKSLNRGTVPGFRRGGLIGSGNVRYRANGSNGPESGGGSLSIDSSGLQGVLTEFGANFKESLDNMITTFSNVGTSMQNLATALGQGMTITHNFSGDLSLAFSIQNQDQLKNAVADAIQPKIEQIISGELDRRLDQFNAGG